MKKYKLLILSSRFGDGHEQAANAIQRAAQSQSQNVETIVMDFMEWVHPLIQPISRYVYYQGIKKFPSLYGYLYQKTRYGRPSLIMRSFTQLGLRKLQELLNEIQPTSVVCTFPFAAAAMSLLKSKGLTDVHTVTVVTDHTDHSYWIHPNTDLYIVSSPEVGRALNRLGIPNAKISTTGIPILPEFIHSHNVQLLKRKYGLDPFSPTILVMGGGLGMIGNGITRLFTDLESKETLQIIVVCGRNDKLKQQLLKNVEHSKHRVYVTGFVDCIHEMMAISDLLITKPGGLTTSEALASELPMVFYHALPGQEEDNARFLVRAGVAVRAIDDWDLVEKVKMIINDPMRLKRMKDNTKQYNSKNAAYKALKSIVSSQ